MSPAWDTPIYSIHTMLAAKKWLLHLWAKRSPAQGLLLTQSLGVTPNEALGTTQRQRFCMHSHLFSRQHTFCCLTRYHSTPVSASYYEPPLSTPTSSS